MCHEELRDRFVVIYWRTYIKSRKRHCGRPESARKPKLKERRRKESEERRVDHLSDGRASKGKLYRIRNSAFHWKISYFFWVDAALLPKYFSSARNM